MPRANALTRPLDEITVGELRAVLAAGDENVTIAAAVAELAEAARVTALHELDVRRYQAYVDRRAQRHAEALATAAATADKRNRHRARGDGEFTAPSDGAQMAARRSARLEADEEFTITEPLLAFQEWIEAGRPEVHRVEGAGVFRRAVETVVELVQ